MVQKQLQSLKNIKWGVFKLDLSQMSHEEAYKTFMKNAVFYMDVKGTTKKLESLWESRDFFGDMYKELAANVGSENMFVYSLNDSDQLLEGYRFVNIYHRIVTTTHFKLPEWGIEL